MKLTYIYAKDFDKKSEWSFNLGSNFIFKFQDNVLEIEENKNYIERFYKLEDYEDINVDIDFSAIIGENGTGKTTIVNKLHNLVFNEISKNLNYFSDNFKYLIIQDTHNHLFINHNFDKQEILLKSNSIKNLNSKYMLNKENKLIEYKKLKDRIVCAIRNDVNRGVNFNIVSYLISNVFDPSRTFERNIYSTNTEISRIIDENNNQRLNSSQIFNSYLIKDLNLQIELLKILSNNETLNFPKKLIIQLRSSSEIFNEVFKILPLEIQKKQYNKIRLNITKPDYFYTIKKIPFYLSYNIMEYLYFLVEMIIRIEDNPSEVKITKISKDLIEIYNEFSRVDKNYISRMLNYISQLYKEEGFSNNKIFWEKIKDELHFVMNLENNSEFNLDNNGFFTIDINHKQHMLQMIEKIYSNQSQVNLFKLRWENQSSGQRAIIKLLGNIYKALKDICNKNSNEYDTPTNILLLIDEIDLYFHPQWQKKALLTINLAVHEMLREMSTLNRDVNLQIIFTTHSPFLVSDLTADRVLFLEFDSSNKVIVRDNLEDLNRTFGANIHELYANSFFLKGGLIGEFAKQRINHIANVLITYMPNQNHMIDWESIRRQINVVGEPILRSRLIQLYDEKRKLSEPLPDEMAKMKEELVELQIQIENVQKRIQGIEQNGENNDSH